MTRETYLIEMDDVLPSPADVNGDGTVDIQDLTLIADAFDQADGVISSSRLDVNGEGVVNVTDLILVTNVMNSQ